MGKEGNEMTSGVQPEQYDEGYWSALLQSEEDECRLTAASARPGPINGGQLGRELDWHKLQHLKDEEAVLECCVEGYNRGGLLAESELLCGFVPISHLVDCPPCKEDHEREQRLKAYLGRSLAVKIIECDQTRGRVVLSERAALAAPGMRNKLFHEMSAGQTLCGRVTNIKDFGVFVDLGGVEGLVHISELSWGRVSNPALLLALDESVDVQVLGLDEKRGRVSLSIKRLLPNPWDDVEARYPAGKTVHAQVSEVVPFGLFVRLEDGLEGLIHKTELRTESNAGQALDFSIGDSIVAEVLSVEPQRQRLSLRRTTG